MQHTFELHTYRSGPVQTNCYLLLPQNSQEAVVIDPSYGSFARISQFLKEQNKPVTKVLLTHSHWDHIADLALFEECYHPEILVHREDAPNVKTPGIDGLTVWIQIKGAHPTRLIEENDEILIGDTAWKVIHTPGHSPGGISLYSEKEKVLFSGDTLFKGTVGRIDLPTSEPERMWDSLKKLSHLPKETLVYSGHGPVTTIGQESWLKNAKEFLGG